MRLLLLALFFLGSCTNNLPEGTQDLVTSGIDGTIRRIALPDGWLVTFTGGAGRAVCYVPNNLNWELKK